MHDVLPDPFDPARGPENASWPQSEGYDIGPTHIVWIIWRGQAGAVP
jgi:hypothetical protein